MYVSVLCLLRVSKMGNIPQTVAKYNCYNMSNSGGFQLSPDFRPRASSNTSSGGRLSPIPAVVGVEPDWSSPTQFPSTNYSPEMPGTGNSPDHLAGTFEHGMKLQEAWGCVFVSKFLFLVLYVRFFLLQLFKRSNTPTTTTAIYRPIRIYT